MTFVDDLNAQWRRLCDGVESRTAVEEFVVDVAVEPAFAGCDTSSLAAVLHALHSPGSDAVAYEVLVTRVVCLIRFAQCGGQVAERTLIQSFVGVAVRELARSTAGSGENGRRPSGDELFEWSSAAVAALWQEIHAVDLDRSARPIAALSWAVRRSIRGSRRDWLRIIGTEICDPTLEEWADQLRSSVDIWGGLDAPVTPAVELLDRMRLRDIISDDEYRVVRSHDLDGWKMTELAQVQGITAAAVRQRRHRALQRIRSHTSREALVG